MAPAKKSTANQRKEYNVEKYIQWVTTLSLTIRVYLHSFSSCCPPPYLQNHAKFSENFDFIAVQRHPRSLILLPIERTYATFSIYSSLLLQNSKIAFPHHTLVWRPLAKERPAIST